MEALANCSARASDSRISRRLKALPVDALLALILVDGAAESGSVSGKIWPPNKTKIGKRVRRLGEQAAAGRAASRAGGNGMNREFHAIVKTT